MKRETLIWKPPTHRDDNEARNFDQKLKKWLQPLTSPGKNEALNFTEEQILGILLINNYDFRNSRTDIRHYVSNIHRNDLTKDEIKKLKRGIAEYGDDLNKISRSFDINSQSLISYFYLNYMKDSELSLKELHVNMETRTRKNARAIKAAKKQRKEEEKYSADTSFASSSRSIIASAPTPSDFEFFEIPQSVITGIKVFE